MEHVWASVAWTVLLIDRWMVWRWCHCYHFVIPWTHFKTTMSFYDFIFCLLQINTLLYCDFIRDSVMLYHLWISSYAPLLPPFVIYVRADDIYKTSHVSFHLLFFRFFAALFTMLTNNLECFRKVVFAWNCGKL